MMEGGAPLDLYSLESVTLSITEKYACVKSRLNYACIKLRFG